MTGDKKFTRYVLSNDVKEVIKELSNELQEDILIEVLESIALDHAIEKHGPCYSGDDHANIILEEEKQELRDEVNHLFTDNNIEIYRNIIKETLDCIAVLKKKDMS